MPNPLSPLAEALRGNTGNAPQGQGGLGGVAPAGPAQSSQPLQAYPSLYAPSDTWDKMLGLQKPDPPVMRAIFPGGFGGWGQ